MKAAGIQEKAAEKGGRSAISGIKSKVVVRFRENEKIIKGYTYDFNPNVKKFHVTHHDKENEISEVLVSQLKALFFVKTFEGKHQNAPHPPISEESLKEVKGMKLKITFSDKEVMFGTTHGYAPDRQGFFVFPADPDSNNERVFVIKDAIDNIEIWR